MNEDRFRDLYDRHAASLAAYLARVSGDRELAADLVQETFSRFYAADLPPMDSGECKSYLYRIATNLVRDRWRRARETAAVVSSEARAVDLDAAIDIRSALSMVTPRERELLWLAYVDGATHQEIADRTGLRSRSVRTLLLRARGKMVRILKGGR
jgi:RNA polymerase sigma-70 factor (ECF subfamily)